MPLYVAVGKAADRLGVSEKRLRTSIRRGDLSLYRLGGFRRGLLRWSDVETWAASDPIPVEDPDEATERWLRAEIRRPKRRAGKRSNREARHEP